VGKLEGKRPLRTPGRIWVHNINMDLPRKSMACVNWIDLAQNRDRWRALDNKGNAPLDSITCGEFLDKLRTC